MIACAAQVLDIETADYHARPELSNSKLKILADSPRLFHAQFVAKTMLQEANHEMEIGTLLHAKLLEPDKFDSLFAIPPREVLNEKGYRMGATWKSWKAENDGKIILEAEEIGQIEAMENAVRSHKFISEFLFAMPGENEQKVFWNYDGLPMRSMLDRLCDNWIVDLKTTRHANIFQFKRDAIRLRYFQQAAFYVDAACSLDGKVRDFAMIAVENRAPYRVFYNEFTTDCLLHGRTEYQRAVAKYKECVESDDWRDDIEKEVNYIDLPTYLGEVKLEGFDDA